MNRTIETLRLQRISLQSTVEQKPALETTSTVVLAAAPLQPYTKVIEIPISYLRDPQLRDAHHDLSLDLFGDPLFEPTPGLSFQIAFKLRDTWNYDPDPRNRSGLAVQVTANGPNEDLQIPNILSLAVLRHADMIAQHRGGEYRGERGWREISTFGLEVLLDLTAIRVELEMSPKVRPA